MPTDSVIADLERRVQSGYSVLMLETHEEQRWQPALHLLAEKLDREFVSWSETSSETPRELLLDTLEKFSSGEKKGQLLVLKDIQPLLADSQIVRAIREVAFSSSQTKNCLVLLGSHLELPVELEKDAYRLSLPLPDYQDVKELFDEVFESVPVKNREHWDLDEYQIDRLVQTLLGLTLNQARNALTQCLQRAGTEFNDDVFLNLVAEKKNLLQGSDLLEYYDLSTGMQSVGGLEAMKLWLHQRANAFSEISRSQGVPAPRGVLIIGVQGCGKSLVARAVAHQLKFPLLRLDISTLLASDRGVSERNMRRALQTAETMAPSVLWIDELDKGFAGAHLDVGKDSTLSRLLGRFLTWMEEQRGKVFVVATANKIDQLPPETVRRGRFDELFFVDLPNYYERTDIFKIHMRSRNLDPAGFDLHELVEKTDGYSGAEIEQIVSSTVLECFSEHQAVTQEKLLETTDEVVPLSKTMEDELFHMREWANGRCRKATPDSRVQQMLDTEKRAGALSVEGAAATAQQDWQRLAKTENFQAAISEYIRVNDHCTPEELQHAFKPYFETRGEHGLVLKSDHNIMVGMGYSTELNTILGGLINSKRFYLHPVPVVRYQKPFMVPVLDELPMEKMDVFHWLPVCYRIVPPEGGSGKLGNVLRIKKSG